MSFWRLSPILLCLCSFSLRAEQYFLDVYYVKRGESLESIAKDFLPEKKLEYQDDVEAYIKDLKAWNPHVEDWSQLRPGTALYKSYPHSTYVGEGTAPSILTRMKKFPNEGLGRGLDLSLGARAAEKSLKQSFENSQFVGTLSSDYEAWGAEMRLSYYIPQSSHGLSFFVSYDSSNAMTLNSSLAGTQAKVDTKPDVEGEGEYLYQFPRWGFSALVGTSYLTTSRLQYSNLSNAGVQTEAISLFYALVGLNQKSYLSRSLFDTKIIYGKSLSAPQGLSSQVLQFSSEWIYREAFGVRLQYKKLELQATEQADIDSWSLGLNYYFF